MTKSALFTRVKRNTYPASFVSAQEGDDIRNIFRFTNRRARVFDALFEFLRLSERSTQVNRRRNEESTVAFHMSLVIAGIALARVHEEEERTYDQG